MSQTRAGTRTGAHSRYPSTAAIALALLLVASVIGIWRASADVQPSGSVSVGISPGNKSVQVGDRFVVQVVVNAGANQVRSADVHLKFDPDYVVLTGAPTAGDLPLMLVQQYNNTAGTIDVGAMTTSSPATGSVILCSVEFMARASTTGTLLELNSGWPTPLLVVGDSTHSTSWSNGTVVIGGAATDTPTATPTSTSTNTPTATAVPPSATAAVTATDAPSPTVTNTPDTGMLCIAVFYDTNEDGKQQAGEVMLSGAQVVVRDTGGNVVAEFTSDAINSPRCESLASGRTYYVDVTPVSGYMATKAHTATAIIHGGHTVSLDFGEVSPLGAPTPATGATPDGERLYLPLIWNTEDCSQSVLPATTLDRIGVAVYRSDEPSEAHLGDYPLDRIQFGWYVDWWFQVDLTKPDDRMYVRILPVDHLYPADPTNVIWDQIRNQAALDPGAIWLIGNEPECIHQGNRTPEEYAAIYKTYYDYLKSVDPCCTVGIGGVVQPTPLRLEWLDDCLASYESQFGEAMPVEVWNIHNMVLNEEAGEIGADIPVGQSYESGRVLQYTDSDSLNIFCQQIVDFRTWMADNGYREMPLLVSEFGVLYPEQWFDALGPPGGEARIKAYMTNTFDYMLNQTDPTIGCPQDGDRLVQRWAYLSLNSPTWEEDWENHFSGHLCYQADQTMTVYGLHWEELISGFLAAGS